VENYLATLKDRGAARPEDFMDNSIIAELDHEGFIKCGIQAIPELNAGGRDGTAGS
jgi:hypothetical protein